MPRKPRRQPIAAGCDDIDKYERKHYEITRSVTLSIDLGAFLVRLLVTIGVPLLVVVFFFEGMVIGKAGRPGALFVLYHVLIRPTHIEVYLVGLLCAMATTSGQVSMYLAIDTDRPAFSRLRSSVPYVESILSRGHAAVESRYLRIANSLFVRFGGIAICVSNVIPGARCLSSIPAAANGYPPKRFALAALLGNLAYMATLVVIVWGIRGVTQYLPWP